MKKIQKTQVLAAVIILSILYWALMGPSPNEFIDWTREIVDKLGWIGPFAYTAGYIVISLTGFSVTIMNLAALAIFTPITAFWTMVLGATIGAAIAFVASDRFFATTADSSADLSKTNKSVQSIVARIEKEAKQHPFRLVFGLRLLRLPYIALSYAAGLAANIPLREFILATMLSNIITAVFYVSAGAAITNASAIVLAVAITVLLVVWLLRSRGKKTSGANLNSPD